MPDRESNPIRSIAECVKHETQTIMMLCINVFTVLSF